MNPAATRAAAVLAAAAPFVGAVTWLLVRPPETLLDRRERRLALALVEDVWRAAAAARPPEPVVEAPEPAPVVVTTEPVPALVQPRELVA